jgi:solute:Na+ symporter, SSS family
VAFSLDAIVTVAVSLVTQPKPVEQLDGLVWGMAAEAPELTPEERVWWRNPKVLGAIAIALIVILNIIFI